MHMKHSLQGHRGWLGSCFQHWIPLKQPSIPWFLEAEFIRATRCNKTPGIPGTFLKSTYPSYQSLFICHWTIPSILVCLLLSGWSFPSQRTLRENEPSLKRPQSGWGPNVLEPITILIYSILYYSYSFCVFCMFPSVAEAANLSFRLPALSKEPGDSSGCDGSGCRSSSSPKWFWAQRGSSWVDDWYPLVN